MKDHIEAYKQIKKSKTKEYLELVDKVKTALSKISQSLVTKEKRKEIIDNIEKRNLARKEHFVLIRYFPSLICSVIKAVNLLYEKEQELLNPQGQEEALSSQLRNYLAITLGEELGANCIEVDYNYSKHLQLPKRIDDKGIKPDLVIHKRCTDIFNIVAIEVKHQRKLNQQDLCKLKKLTDDNKEYKYDLGIGLELGAQDYKMYLFYSGEKINEESI